jgi:hypothetical protein
MRPEGCLRIIDHFIFRSPPAGVRADDDKVGAVGR